MFHLNPPLAKAHTHGTLLLCFERPQCQLRPFFNAVQSGNLFLFKCLINSNLDLLNVNVMIRVFFEKHLCCVNALCQCRGSRGSPGVRGYFEVEDLVWSKDFMGKSEE